MWRDELRTPDVSFWTYAVERSMQGRIPPNTVPGAAVSLAPSGWNGRSCWITHSTSSLWPSCKKGSMKPGLHQTKKSSLTVTAEIAPPTLIWRSGFWDILESKIISALGTNGLPGWTCRLTRTKRHQAPKGPCILVTAHSHFIERVNYVV